MAMCRFRRHGLGSFVGRLKEATCTGTISAVRILYHKSPKKDIGIALFGENCYDMNSKHIPISML